MADSSSKHEEVVVSIPPRRSVLQRVPVPLRENEKQKHIYEPVAVPLGPYHHGRRPEFHLVEQLKEKVLDMVCGDRDRALPLRLVSERLLEIRQFYGGADGFGDGELAELMLRDTCFMLCFITGNSDKFGAICKGVGVCGIVFMWRDFLMLENQIPLWLMSLLTPFVCGDDHDSEPQLFEFVLKMISPNPEATTRMAFPRRNRNHQPLHILDAAHLMLLASVIVDSDSQPNTGQKPAPQIFNMLRSATDLKAKGIHLRPSTQSLKHIRFFSFSTHGQLLLPEFRISDTSRVFLSNLVAYELSSNGSMDLGLIQYVSLMKILLRGAEDVELMREKGILYSSLPNEEVVRLFHDIDTCGAPNPVHFNNVKRRIEEHCKNKGKTWLAELINTYFHSPLTAVALFAAAFILALTFLQTFYTINPRYTNGR